MKLHNVDQREIERFSKPGEDKCIFIKGMFKKRMKDGNGGYIEVEGTSVRRRCWVTDCEIYPNHKLYICNGKNWEMFDELERTALASKLGYKDWFDFMIYNYRNLFPDDEAFCRGVMVLMT